MNLGAMIMKGTRYSPKPQHYCYLTIRLFSVIYRTLFVVSGGGGGYPFAEKQSMYSTAPADCANLYWEYLIAFYCAKTTRKM